MSPSVERFSAKELDRSINFFTVDLNTDEPFDIDYFDLLFKKAFPVELNLSTSKYIVYENIMYLFNCVLNHNEFFIAKQKELQSAGKVRVSFGEQKITRVVYDYSVTLQRNCGLSKFGSDDYKYKVLREKLAPHFDIE